MSSREMESFLSRWKTTRSVPKLLPGVVDMFAFSLAASEQRICSLERSLVHSEIERADRFVNPQHRTCFVVSRSVLRTILGTHLHSFPSSLELATGSNGKPMLSRSTEASLRFNLAHSKGLAIVAITVDREVGVDVEYLDANRATDEIADRFLAPAEKTALKRLYGQERVDAFFRCWTRKEAYLKARGDGLAVALDGFDVTIGPEQVPVLNASDSFRWEMRSLIPAQGFFGAIVFETPVSDLRCWWLDLDWIEGH